MLEEFHGQRSLEGYNPWGKEADTTEGLADLFNICSAKYLQQKKRKFLSGAMSVIIMQLKKKKFTRHGTFPTLEILMSQR